MALVPKEPRSGSSVYSRLETCTQNDKTGQKMVINPQLLFKQKIMGSQRRKFYLF